MRGAVSVRDEQFVSRAPRRRCESSVLRERFELIGRERALGGGFALRDGIDRPPEPVGCGRVGIVERFERGEQRGAALAYERLPRGAGVLVALTLARHRLDGRNRAGRFVIGS